MNRIVENGEVHRIAKAAAKGVKAYKENDKRSSNVYIFRKLIHSRESRKSQPEKIKQLIIMVDYAEANGGMKPKVFVANILSVETSFALLIHR